MVEMPGDRTTRFARAADVPLPTDRGRRRRCVIASAAIVGFAAVLVVCAHRSASPVRGHAPALTACHSSMAWTAVLPGAPTALARVSRPALHGTFWVGLLSLASGVAVVRLAAFLRTVRIGSRCGH